MDDVDRDRIRSGLSAFGAIVGGGIGLVVALQYIAFVCAPSDCGSEMLPMSGLLAAWSAIGAVAGGLWGWHRDVPTGAVAAFWLAFMALHFVSANSWVLYGPLLESALGLLGPGAAGTAVAFLVYWTLAAALGVALVWRGARGVAWLLARWEHGELPRV